MSRLFALLWLAAAALLPAAELSPEQCAARLQRATVTVRIRLHPESAKETVEGEESSTQLTVCSGVAVGEKLIATAAFAAADSQIRITLAGGEQTDARLTVLDEFSGLALLEAIDAKLSPLEFAAQNAVAGGWVMTSAGWGAEQPLVSVGVVGGVDRAIKGYVYPPLLQCDVQAAETSSGAPVINHAGELLGVIVAGQRSEQQRGWLYAVPVSHVQRLLRARTERAKEDAVVVLKRRRPTCGVDLEAVDAGIVVSKVEPNGPAEKAGLKPGDRILSADGQNVRYLYEAKRPTLYKQPGDTMTFVVQRGDVQKRIELVLGGGVELPTASLEVLDKLVAPKIDIGLTTKRNLTGTVQADVTIREAYSSPPAQERDGGNSEKLRLLEKANERYRLVIEQQQKELARRDELQRAQAQSLEALKNELESMKRKSGR
jgi:S1-C subfamily serine protease